MLTPVSSVLLGRWFAGGRKKPQHRQPQVRDSLVTAYSFKRPQRKKRTISSACVWMMWNTHKMAAQMKTPKKEKWFILDVCFDAEYVFVRYKRSLHLVCPFSTTHPSRHAWWRMSTVIFLMMVCVSNRHAVCHMHAYTKAPHAATQIVCTKCASSPIIIGHITIQP